MYTDKGTKILWKPNKNPNNWIPWKKGFVYNSNTKQVKGRFTDREMNFGNPNPAPAAGEAENGKRMQKLQDQSSGFQRYCQGVDKSLESTNNTNSAPGNTPGFRRCFARPRADPVDYYPKAMPFQNHKKAPFRSGRFDYNSNSTYESFVHKSQRYVPYATPTKGSLPCTATSLNIDGWMDKTVKMEVKEEPVSMGGESHVLIYNAMQGMQTGQLETGKHLVANPLFGNHATIKVEPNTERLFSEDQERFQQKQGNAEERIMNGLPGDQPQSGYLPDPRLQRRQERLFQEKRKSEANQERTNKNPTLRLSTPPNEPCCNKSLTNRSNDVTKDENKLDEAGSQNKVAQTPPLSVTQWLLKRVCEDNKHVPQPTALKKSKPKLSMQEILQIYGGVIDICGLTWVMNVLSVDDEALDEKEMEIITRAQERQAWCDHEGLKACVEQRQNLTNSKEKFREFIEVLAC